jgi:hypothetical protein
MAKPTEIQIKTVNSFEPTESDGGMEGLTYEVRPGDGTEWVEGETEILGLTVTCFGEDDNSPGRSYMILLSREGYEPRNPQNWVLKTGPA